MGSVQRLVTQAHASGGTGCQVLHQHICAGDDVQQDTQRGRLLQIERQAFLGAVDPDEMRSLTVHPLVIGAGKVTHARTLDLDDAGTEISELTGTKGCGNGVL